jgi:hypothetical protein
VVFPDITGELWKDAVATTELAPEWMAELQRAAGAVLFIRILSESNCDPLDWATMDRLLTMTKFSDVDEMKSKGVPTQVALCELLRFLEHTLPVREGEGKGKPRVAVAVTAWDLVDEKTAAKGTVAFLRKDYPLFAGRLDDIESLDVAVFGVSVCGGDFKDPDFKARYLKGEAAGYATTGGGKALVVEPDVTMPIAWVLGDEPSP